MNLKYFSLLSVFLVGLAISQPNKVDIVKEYARGLVYFNLENPTDASDKKAIEHFKKVIIQPLRNYEDAEIQTKANEKLGVLLQMQNEFEKAKSYYKNSLKIADNFKLVDSVKFRPNLYLSGLYYYESVYDSCLFYLSQAENILDKYPKLPESVRLYNTKGVLMFESGNFRQSLAYFKKAEEQTTTDDFSNANNQALALQFLNQPDSTYIILQGLEKRFPREEQLKINLASVLIELGKPRQALEYLKIPLADSANYFNTVGKAYVKLGDWKMAEFYFHKTIGLNSVNSANKGFAFYDLGNIASQRCMPYKALYYYQSALNELDYAFDSKNKFHNPQSMGSEFTSFFELDILSAKMWQFDKLYRKTHKQHYFRGAERAFGAYEDLVDDIVKDYSQENARLDLLTHIQPNYKAYLNLLVEAYRTTNDEHFMQQVFEVGERSKALVLALTINENQLKNTSDIPQELQTLEKNLHTTLALHKRNLQNNQDRAKTRKYLEAINETELKIGKLHESLERFPEYKRRKNEDVGKFRVRDIQNSLSSNDFLVSYLNLGKSAVVFGVSSSEFKFNFLEDAGGLKTKIAEIKELKSQQKTQEQVYTQLFRPFEAILKSKSNLIFVGDAETNGLPLDLLRDAQGHYLVERHAVSYLFSAKFLWNTKTNNHDHKILGFAPFSESNVGKDFLPNSKSELLESNFEKKYLGNDANKKKFIEEAGNFTILHLATHAHADVASPEKSFIRFAKDSNSNDKLYLFEFSAGMLKNMDLVFLSACDSYGNSNILGEGIRGLSRGFYLAGSKSIISSLWKAEDFATAYLTKKFYEHLDEGDSFATALKNAKLDLLHDKEMIQFRDPQYWAHLIFVGYQNKTTGFANLSAAILALSFLIIFIWFYLQKSSILGLRA